MLPYPPGHSRIDRENGAASATFRLVWMRGGGSVRLGGRVIEAPPGSFCVLPCDPASWLCDVGGGGAVAVELPQEMDARSDLHLRVALGSVIDGGVGAVAFLRAFLETLETQQAYQAEFPGWVEASICDLVERVIAESSGPRPTSAQRAVLGGRDYVLSHLADPDLTPQHVADSAAVSLRTLNRLFAAQGDSVGNCIRRERLERCRLDLIDPDKADRGIAQIAAFWGFSEAPHFSRIFKEAYGSSPRAYRAAALHPDSVDCPEVAACPEAANSPEAADWPAELSRSVSGATA